MKKAEKEYIWYIKNDYTLIYNITRTH